METKEIIDYLKKDKTALDYVLYILLQDETITISELVRIKENAMKERLLENKEDLSNASALLLRYMEGKNKVTLQDDAKEFIKKQGFFKID